MQSSIREAGSHRRCDELPAGPFGCQRLPILDSRRLTNTKARRPSPTNRSGIGLVGEMSAAITASVGGPVGVLRLEPDDAAAAAVIRWFEMLVEQMTRAPPPFAEPLHWLILTPWDEGFVPVAVHLS